MAEQKQYTKSEIKQNQDNDKVLLILHDKVYNVHPFLNEHPGGEEILLDHKGKDGSEDFDDIGHSHNAMDLMEKYQVGVIVESERRNKSPKKGWVAGYDNQPQSYIQGPGTPFYVFIGAAFVLVTAILYYAH